MNEADREEFLRRLGVMLEPYIGGEGSASLNELINGTSEIDRLMQEALEEIVLCGRLRSDVAPTLDEVNAAIRKGLGVDAPVTEVPVAPTKEGGSDGGA